MLRRLVALCFILCVFFIASKDAQAFGVKVSLDRTIPTVNCGLPERPEAEACCYFAPLEIDEASPFISSLIDIGLPSFIPNPLRIWNDVREYYLDFQDSVAEKQPCVQGEPFPRGISPSDDSCVCKVLDDPVRESIVEMCTARLSPSERSKASPLSTAESDRLDRELGNCIACANQNGYYSGIGCIQFSLVDFITTWIFGFGVGLAGLAALFCIIIASIRIQVSQGNADSVQKAKEMMTSCILGLLLIVFSVFLLNVAGITLLPGFLF